MNNLITIAVTENKPELITSNRNFNVNSLMTEGCGLTHFRNIIEEKFTPFACRGLSCKSCPFGCKEPDSNNTDNQTIESMREWLKLDQRPLPNDLKENLDNLKIEAEKLLTEVINKRKLSQPKTYTEKEFKNAYRQGAKDYCRSFKGLQSFLKEDVNIWFNNNKKK